MNDPINILLAKDKIKINIAVAFHLALIVNGIMNFLWTLIGTGAK